MNPRIINAIFGLITIGAVAVAITVWTTSSSLPESKPTPSTSPSTSSIVSTPTPSPIVSPSATPSASPKQYSPTQGLAVANMIEVIEPGGSLVNVATKYSLTIDNLVKVNSIADQDKVFAGQTLVIPDSVTTTDYTVLYTLNESKLTVEKSKLTQGVKSIYSDPVTATYADAKNVFGINSDTPFSTTLNENGSAATLQSSTPSWIISVSLEKQADGLWVMKRLIAKKSIS